MTTVIVLWNGDDEYEIMDSSGNCLERYQQGMAIDGIAGRQIGQGSLSDRYIKDHIGSVQRVIRENGTEENEYIYDSFGNIIYQSGTLSNQRLYTSRYYDSESGLYYYRARYYDSNTGRFISEDPAWGNIFQNYYLYVENNPVNSIDPTGLECIPLFRIPSGIRINIHNKIISLSPWELFLEREVGPANIQGGAGILAGLALIIKLECYYRRTKTIERTTEITLSVKVFELCCCKGSFFVNCKMNIRDEAATESFTQLIKEIETTRIIKYYTPILPYNPSCEGTL